MHYSSFVHYPCFISLACFVKHTNYEEHKHSKFSCCTLFFSSLYIYNDDKGLLDGCSWHCSACNSICALNINCTNQLHQQCQLYSAATSHESRSRMTGVTNRASNKRSRRFHNDGESPYLGYTCLAYCLKCESTSGRFQPAAGPSRGLLRDCEIFAICSSSHHRECQG